MNAELTKRLAFANRLANEAGRVIRPYFRKRIEITDKGEEGLFDPVTKADSGAEKAIRKMIEKAYPKDGILGEEWGAKDGTSGYRWVLDPVDGTRAFIAGQPLWGTLIALEKNGHPVIGLLDQPFLKERFIGVDGKAHLKTGVKTTRLKTRACAKLGEALICTTHPHLHFPEDDREKYFRVEHAARLSRYGGDCYAYALLAMGFSDIVVEADLKRWDVAAIIPIVEGAGGIVTDWSGKPITSGGNIVAAGDKRVHAEALKLLNA